MIAFRCCKTCREKPTAKGRRECWRCVHGKWAKRHPRRALFWNINTSARKRGIQFAITYEEFSLFCDLTGYDYLVGKNPDDLTIDRIDPRKGYLIDNIRVISHAQNSSENNSKKRLQTMRIYGHTFGA